jgi:hypothetical protein
MEKKCFIIMPISDSNDYPADHFKRVYNHLIKPACERASFKPIRADDILTTNYIGLDILKNILSCEMAICDLSSRNPNVLYELGIRQAFNLPVTLLKDSRTSRIFDIQGFRDVEYDESLRIDSVEDTIKALSETIKNTYSNKTEVNSLISLLGIEPARISERTKISSDTELILNTLLGPDKRIGLIENKIQANPTKIFFQNPSPEIIPDEVGEQFGLNELENLKPGEMVYHHKFGKGKVVSISTDRPDKTGLIDFINVGPKSLLLSFSRLQRVN